MEGEWTPGRAEAVTQKTSEEAIRYLGIHFALDGNWATQHQILEERLECCLKSMYYRQMTRAQITYVLNAVVLPKLSYPLAVTGVSFWRSNLVAKLDAKVRKFLRTYMSLPASYSTNAFHAPKNRWGWGVNSLEDIMCADVAANTLVSLNDWMVGRQWKDTSETQPELYKGTDLYELHAKTANMYPTLLVGALDEDMGSGPAGSFFPFRHTRTQLGRRDGSTNTHVTRISKLLSRKGYTIDTPLAESEEGRDNMERNRNYIARTLPMRHIARREVSRPCDEMRNWGHGRLPEPVRNQASHVGALPPPTQDPGERAR